MYGILAFPAVLLAIFIISFLGPNMFNAMLAIASLIIPIMARVARSQVFSIKKEGFVLAAKAIGKKPVYILFRHI